MVSDNANGHMGVDRIFVGGMSREIPLEEIEEGVGGTLEVENISDLSKKMYLMKSRVDRAIAIIWRKDKAVKMLFTTHLFITWSTERLKAFHQRY